MSLSDKKTVAACCVVTPFYHWPLREEEEISLAVLRQVLAGWPRCFIAPGGFDLPADFLQPGEFVVRFPAHFFRDIAGYNKLLVDPSFFEAFAGFRYMLLYQLDCLVFHDAVQDWVDRDFDYIGSPWLPGQGPALPSDPELVGNGGFSLRKVDTALRVLSHSIPRGSLFPVPPPGSPQPTGVAWLAKNLTRKFREHSGLWTVRDELDNYFDNEDEFWSKHAPRILSSYRKPAPAEARKFSLELDPAHWHRQMKGFIPFGCHGWHKYEPEFWLRLLDQQRLIDLSSPSAQKFLTNH